MHNKNLWIVITGSLSALGEKIKKIAEEDFDIHIPTICKYDSCAMTSGSRVIMIFVNWGKTDKRISGSRRLTVYFEITQELKTFYTGE